MKCAYCHHIENKVLDSRAADEGKAIRRRRECLQCSKRFTTYETIETTPLLVVKSDGTRELFDSAKIKNGIIRACQKRPVAAMQIDELIQAITYKMHNALEQEVKTSTIGEHVMEGLKKLDDIAYVRFASVYRQFTDVTTFVNFIQERMTDIEKNANK